MTNQNHNFPKTAPVAPSASDNGAPANIPALTIADFPLDYAGAYHLNEMGMAELIKDRRGLPNRLLINAETGDVIHVVTGEYTAVPNAQVDGFMREILMDLFPTKYLQNVELKEKVENQYAFTQLDYGLKDFAFKVKADHDWETTFSPVVSIKNAAQNSVITITSAKCATTGNIISFGNKAAISQRHVGKFSKAPMEAHLRHTLLQFPKAIKAIQNFADQSINLSQAENALNMYTNMTDNVRLDILEQYTQVTAPEMGRNKLALMMAVADFANDPEAFPVKNAAKADNIAETLATRKKWKASLMSSPFFFGRGGFYA
jgi:hypothetical protein